MYSVDKTCRAFTCFSFPRLLLMFINQNVNLLLWMLGVEEEVTVGGTHLTQHALFHPSVLQRVLHINSS